MDNKEPSSSARVIDDGKSQITRSSFISPSAAPLFLFLNSNADDEAVDEAMASGIHPVTRKQLPRHSWPASRREQMQRPRSSMAIDPGQQPSINRSCRTHSSSKQNFHCARHHLHVTSKQNAT
ncbi:hypothetical protein ACLOJK_036693, partial [Asimina triloba]